MSMKTNRHTAQAVVRNITPATKLQHFLTPPHPTGVGVRSICSLSQLPPHKPTPQLCGHPTTQKEVTNTNRSRIDQGELEADTNAQHMDVRFCNCAHKVELVMQSS